jgi:hypothetical protein
LVLAQGAILIAQLLQCRLHLFELVLQGAQARIVVAGRGGEAGAAENKKHDRQREAAGHLSGVVHRVQFHGS